MGRRHKRALCSHGDLWTPFSLPLRASRLHSRSASQSEHAGTRSGCLSPPMSGGDCSFSFPLQTSFIVSTTNLIQFVSRYAVPKNSVIARTASPYYINHPTANRRACALDTAERMPERCERENAVNNHPHALRDQDIEENTK